MNRSDQPAHPASLFTTGPLPHGPAPACRCDAMPRLDVKVDQTAEALVVRPIGEVDHAEATAFRQPLLAALDQTPGSVVVDLAQLSFIDSTGLTVLLTGRQHANSRGVAFSLAAPQDRVARRLATTGLNVLFDIYDSVDEALTKASQQS